MTIEKIRSLRTLNCNKVRRYLIDTFGDSARTAAFVLVKAGMTDRSELSTMESFLASCTVRSTLVPTLCLSLIDQWQKLSAAVDTFTVEEYAAYLLFDRTASSRLKQDETPECLNQLALTLLDIQATDFVANFCTGKGSFLRDTYLHEPAASYFGNDINEENYFAALMRADLLGDHIRISSEDTLQIVKKFDKIFVDCPFGVKRRFYDPECKNASSADWMFAEKIMHSLKAKGKGAAILTNGSTWNKCDMEMRKEFVMQGYIETVIALPEGLFEQTMVGTVMVILSRDNDTVTFVDASELYVSGRRNNTLSDENIAEIFEAVRKDHPKSRRIPISEVRKNNYNLHPSTYMTAPVISDETKEYIPFSDLITRITRGSQIKANELDEITSETPTHFQFLKLSDIQSGIISKELAYITELAPKYDKYCLKSGSLIISKNGLPIKIAVAEVPDGTKVLANGNLYIIELDTEKVNPYYVKAYLESPEGDAALRNICVGVTIPNIPVESLKKIRIPMIEMAVQNIVAKKYRNKQQEILSLRRRLTEVEQSLYGTYEEIVMTDIP